jgi:F-type H+-transporting ATPase subunit a
MGFFENVCRFTAHDLYTDAGTGNTGKEKQIMGLKEILEHHILDHTYTFIKVGDFTLPITKHLLMMWIVGFILMFLVPFVYRSKIRAFRLFRTAMEAVVVFIREEIVVANMGAEGKKYTSYFCTLFSFILLCNLMGLLPYGATATGNISVTAALAITTFLLINFAGIRQQGPLNYVKSFVPKGVPLWLYPILFPIEILGLVTKTFALCVRLFANMIGGHTVILCFFGLIFIFAKINVFAGVMTIPMSVIMVLFVSLLEIFVAFLQAYIFTFLTAIFTGAALHPH